MKIAIAGTGYVGLVTAVCLASIGHNVTCVDVNEEKIRQLSQGKSTIFENGLQELLTKNKDSLTFTTDYKKAYRDKEMIMIGVGTPEQEDGTANLSYVRTVCNNIVDSINKDVIVVVKSTVPVGTNDEIQRILEDGIHNKYKITVVSNPEFLAQGSAINDTLHAKRIIVGTNDQLAIEKMKELYGPLNIPMVFMKRRSAELTKYACNDFLALKISYINEMADFCEMIGANIEEVARGMSFDPRIGDKYLQPGIGYGGSCFPKDTKALYAFAKQQYGFDFKTIKATIDVNSDQKNRLFFKARRDVGSFQNKNVSILGLTFKPGTDDLRESPAFNTISSLLKDGANVFAYDPIGINNMKKWHETDIVYCSTALEALSKSNIIMILTDWNEFKSIPLDLFSGKRIYDGRNCLSMDVSKYALSYYSVGRI